MKRAFLPFKIVPTHAARNAVGRDLDAVAVLALRAILRHNKSLEVAHQQIRYRHLHLAFSSRVTSNGDLIIDLDVGDPRLADRLILEHDLAVAGGRRRGIALDHDQGRRR